MNRKELKHLAAVRLKEAGCLLENRHYSGAYYLAGYDIECGLKACIAKQTKRFEFPDRKKVADSHTHDLEALLKLANLQADLEAAMNADGQLRINWTVVKDWKETSRYRKNKKDQARDLYHAVDEPTRGVLQWIKRYW
ncbi:MAG TPA: hypothetical protein VFE78_34980 [Gemmataceae bacterium]|jgi:HEPN domain-containing protein|nr:hypothetical protein [Gemmataceae bacterium]